MKHLCTFLLLLLLSNLSIAQNTVHQIDSLVQAISLQHPAVGMSVGFFQNGNATFFNHGFTNQTEEVPVDEHTTFEIGSITKLFTAYLIAQQVAMDKIQVDQFIDAYIPDVLKLNPAIQNQIRISDLASHQSGLPEFDMMQLIQQNPIQPLDEVSLGLVDSILIHTTSLESIGTYRYSNISYVLLGYIIEQALDDTYENSIRNQILQPLQMNQTYTSDFRQGTLTTGYNAKGEPQALFNWNSVMAPAGLLKSNTSDLIQFLKVLLHPKTPSINATIQQTYFKNTFIELGLGLNILRVDDQVIYAKTGDSLGQSSVLAYNPVQQWGVVILTNQANGIARELFGNVLEVMQ